MTVVVILFMRANLYVLKSRGPGFTSRCPEFNSSATLVNR